jgi:serine/threonine protein phosphatase PrpC
MQILPCLLALLVGGFLRGEKSAGALTTSVATVSRAGADPLRPQKVNQDAVIHTRLLGDEPSLCVGVMDGHGLKGHVVTDYMAQQLPVRLAEQLRTPRPQSDWEARMQELAHFDVGADIDNTDDDTAKPQYADIHHALRHAFHQTHTDALEQAGVPAGRSGTTCIVVLVDEAQGVLHVAHVGDSRALCITADGAIQVLTTETTVAKDPADRARVAAGEGRIDARGNVWYGPVAIAMTRALGDGVMLRAGVVPTPRVTTSARLPASVLVVATDGLWDVLSNEQVRDIVLAYADSSVEKMAAQLALQARQAWIGDLPLQEEKVDDITCVVARL